MKPLTVGSLFSGIGGLELGLERAGMRVVWQVECDPYARQVLAKNFPGVPCYSDIRDCAYSGFEMSGRKTLLGKVDVLAGGFPCQDISVAGKGKGIQNGTRSGLWSEFHRLIREIRPRYVLVENVPALRSRGLDRVLGDLAACGYDAEWDGFAASAFGAPHRRDRIFIVAYPEREQLRIKSGGGASGRTGPVRYSLQAMAKLGLLADSYREREPQQSRVFGEERGRSLDSGRQWAVEPDVGRVAHGVPSRVDRLRCLGNAVVPQVAEFVGRCIVAHAEPIRNESEQE